MKSLISVNDMWQHRLTRSGYFFAALLFHLVLFLMLATWVVFKAPAVKEDNATFLPVTVHPPPPSTPPPPSGGQTLNNLEPTVQVTPPPSVASVVATFAPSSFSVKAAASLPNLPASMSVAAGSAMAGHDAPGEAMGAGSPFGSAQNSGTAQMHGYLYDLKQTQDRQTTNMDPGKFHNLIGQFIKSNWSSSFFRNYYKSSRALNTTSIFIPIIKAEDGPKAFGVEKDVQPNMYVVWYKVTAKPPQDGTYHFVGVGDDILEVRVNGRTVLDGSDYGVNDELRNKQKSFKMTNFNPTFELNGNFWVSLPFHASAGDEVNIDVLIGEEPGGKSDYFLFIQREESTYQTQANGSPLLPIFQLDSTPIKPSGLPMTYPPFAATPEPWQAVSSEDQ